MLKYKDVKVLPCLHPPPKAILKQLIIDGLEVAVSNSNDAEEASRLATLLKYLKKYDPDIEWLLTYLSTTDPNCDIFKKGYLPPAKG